MTAPVLSAAFAVAHRLMHAVADDSDNVLFTVEMHRVHVHIKHQALDEACQIRDVDLAVRMGQLRALAVQLGSTISGHPLPSPVGAVEYVRVAGVVLGGVGVTVQACLTLAEAHQLGVLDDFDTHVASSLAVIAP